MTKTDIGIYRGLKEKFDPTIHIGFFITTDTGELLCGNLSLGQTISGWEINDGVLTLRFNTGNDLRVTFPEATETAKGLLSASDKAALNTLADNLSSKVDKVTGKSLIADSEIEKLAGLPNSTELTNSVANAKAAGDNAQSDLNAHKQNTSNPHSVTKEQVGLGNVTNDAQVKRSEMGVAGGVATLDTDGKVPASQLPSYVDDIVDVYATYTKSSTGVLSNIVLYSDAAKTQLVTGEAGKIYQNVTTGEPNYQFRWTGTVFSQTGASSLIIGEVAGTAYDGAKGKANADNIAKVKGTSLTHIKDANPITTTADKVSLNYECYAGEQYGATGTSHTADILSATTTKAGVMSATDKFKLDNIAGGAEVNVLSDWNVTDTTSDAFIKNKPASMPASDVKDWAKADTKPTYTKAEVGLGNVDNTSDTNKPVSTAQAAAIEDAKKAGTDAQTALNNHKENKDKKHIPEGGQEKLILTWKSNGEAKWDNLSNVFNGLEELLAYGVEWDITSADPHITRIGNMSLHKTLPIQSQLRGCIAQGGKIIYWLDENNWKYRKDLEYDTIHIEGSMISIGDYPIGYEPSGFEIALFKYVGSSSGLLGEVSTEKKSCVVNDKFYGRVDFDITTITQDEVKNTIISAPKYEDLELARVIFDNNFNNHDLTVEKLARLDGYDGTVRVYCPSFYIKSQIIGNKRRVWLSTVKIDNTWTYQPAVLIDAYKSTVLNAVPINMGYLSTLPVNSAISVVNTATYCRGYLNKSDGDEYLDTDPFRTGLGKPRTGQGRSITRQQCRNANSEMLSYNLYKNIFYWLWVVEYANFNSQEPYDASLTDEGYHRGGIGLGVADYGNWYEYSNYCPLTPCGYGNHLGNGTGLVPMTVPSFEVNVGAIQNLSAVTIVDNAGTKADGKITITNITSNTRSMIYARYDQIAKTVTFKVTGLNGETLRFETGSGASAVKYAEISTDGNVTVEWPNSFARREFRFSEVKSDVNIVIEVVSAEVGSITANSITRQMPRWRGFDNPFGDTYTNLDGIVIERKTGLSNVWTTNDVTEYTDEIGNKTLAGKEITSEGFIKLFDLGETAEIIPRVDNDGADTSKYKCDYHYTGEEASIFKTLFVGGCALVGGGVGLGCFYSYYGVTGAWYAVGFRSVSSFLSFSNSEG